MIIDALTNMEFYKGLNERLYKGLAFLKETDVASLPVGRYEIYGDEVFALVQEYDTRSADECRWQPTIRTLTSSMSWEVAKRWAGNHWMVS